MNDKIKDGFKNPPSEYSVAPFWSWNETMTGEELEFQMKDFKAHGIMGAFAHPRIGMTTEYLSEEYFRAWRDTLETARREGMKLYIYDENAWPSGSAGGKVAALDESVIGYLAKYRIVDAAEPLFTGEVIYAGEYLGDGKPLGMDLTAYPKEEWGTRLSGKVMVIYYFKPVSSSWTGGYPYVDLTNPRSTELFLQTTYEEYYRRFGDDFGTLIPASFSDEANIHSEGLNTIPFTDHVCKRFKELNGYDLKPNLPAVFRNLGGDFSRPAEKVRYDYYYTLHEMWIDNFVRPMSEWCDKHNIAWTGHDVEHQWPMPHGGRMAPSEMTTYEFRQWPGLDLLLCDHLKTEPSNFDKFEMYEIRSAANQFAKKRTLCEAYGAGGYHSTIADYKRLGDYLLVGGINLLVPHLTLYSLAGTRKRDCPQSFDYRQPWWEEYAEFARYFARESYLLSQGKMEQRILLLNPSTTGYLVPAEEAKGCVDHGTDVGCVSNPDMSDFLTAVNVLTDCQWDFDLGDEFSMERHAKIDGEFLTVGEESYSVVIISKNMKNIRRPIAELLLKYIAAGGTVLATGGGFAEYVDGEKGDDMSEELTNAFTIIDGAEALDAALGGRLERRVTSSVVIPAGVQHMRRLLPDGRVVYFIVNHSMGKFESDITVDGDKAAVWDPFTGESEQLSVKSENGKITFRLSLERCESLTVIVGDSAEREHRFIPAEREVRLIESGIRAERDNSFTVDHVALEIDGETLPYRYFLETADALFSRRGFYENPWKCAIQTNTDYMDKNADYEDGSGFKAHYRVILDDGFEPSRLTAAVERPDLVSVSVNGVLVKSSGVDILDTDFGAYDFTGLMRPGENDITLSADKFNVLCELEAIILRGDFSVKVKDGRFVLSAPETPRYGTWDTFGMSFYPYGMIYSYVADLDKRPDRAIISLGEHNATVASVTVNGRYAGVIGRDESYGADISEYLTSGENKIDVRLAGSFRNMFGPYLGFDETMPYDWSFFERGREASPEDYELIKYGMDCAPTLKVSE